MFRYRFGYSPGINGAYAASGPALPLTPSGKVDRRVLTPQPLLSQASYERTVGAVETRLAEIISALLGVPHVGRHDDFFRISGESIVALQLVNKARGVGISLTAQIVFQYPTVAGMAENRTDDEVVPEETELRLPGVHSMSGHGPRRAR